MLNNIEVLNNLSIFTFFYKQIILLTTLLAFCFVPVSFMLGPLADIIGGRPENLLCGLLVCKRIFMCLSD